MPIPRFTSTGRALLCALAVLILIPAAAKASAGADLRVVTIDGRQLADVRQFADTNPISAPTSPNAKCFFGGKGGSGRRVPVRGPTALGLAVDASASVPALDPILITDEFSFGIGVCGFGGIQPSPTEFWQLRVDHKAVQVGGDQAGTGNDVLWTLVPSPVCDPNPPFACQPTVPELVIDAPPRALPGETVRIHVNQFTDEGAATASLGAVVPGAAQPTDASGVTTMTVTQNTTVSATKPGTIPSSALEICVNADPTLCPEGHGRTMFGSDGQDGIGGTAGADRIKARGGDDTIRVRGGFSDEVDCGGGDDLVQADRTDKVDRASCEQVLRPKLACQRKKRKSRKQRRKCRRKVKRAARA